MANDQQYDQGELDELTDALASQGTDELRITEASAVDISDRAPREIGKARMQDSAGTLIDPATEQTLTNTLAREIATWTAGTLPVEQQTAIEIGTWSAGTLAVEQQTPVAIEDSTGTQVDPAANVDGGSTSASAAGTGSSNAAAITVPDGCRTVTIGYDTSGAASITVEVSPDGGTNWYPLTSFDPGSASNNADTFEVGFDDVRAYIDSNLNTLHIGGKGA